MRRIRLIGILVVATLVGSSAMTAGAETGKVGAIDRLFTLIGDVPLGPASGRLDYQSLDPVARRLYIAGMGAGKLLVFDLAQGQLISALDGFPKITGVLAVPELRRVYASVPGAGLLPALSTALGMAGLSSGRGAIAILDSHDLRSIARLPGGVFPDGIAYDPDHRRTFVSDELGSAVLVIDAATDRLLARIATGGEVGNVQYDPLTRTIYAPVQSRDEFVAIDPAGLRLLYRHPLPGCRHPHGLAVAPKGGIGYFACDGNDRLVSVELVSGRVLEQMPLGHDPDVMAIDAKAGRLYVAAESGTLSSFAIGENAALDALGIVNAGKAAHSVAVDSASHQLYLPLRDVDGRSVLRILAPKL